MLLGLVLKYFAELALPRYFRVPAYAEFRLSWYTALALMG